MTYKDQHYKDASGQLYFLSAQDQANAAAPNWRGRPLPGPDWVAIADAEAETIRNPPPLLAEVQERQCAAIDGGYAVAIAAPIAFTTAAGATALFDASAASVASLTAALTAWTPAEATPAGFYWLATDNSRPAFTLADLRGLSAQIAARQWQAFEQKQSLKAAIRAASTIGTVEAIIWPEGGNQ